MDDVMRTPVRAGATGVRRANQADHRSPQGDRQVHRPGIVTKKHFGQRQNRCQPPHIGTSGEIHRGRATRLRDPVAQRSFIRAADQNAARVTGIAERIDRLHETIGRPHLSFPSRAWCDGEPWIAANQTGIVQQRGGFGQRCFTTRQRKLDWNVVEAQQLGYTVVSIHGVSLRIGNRESMRIKRPRAFAGVAKADSNRRAACPSQEPGAKQALQIDDKIVPARSQIA